MKVTVVCFGAMRDYLPMGSSGNRGTVEVAPQATVADVVDAIGAPTRLVFSVLVDGVQSSLGAPVHAGAVITLMPPFAGG